MNELVFKTVRLSDFTTIRLGGITERFFECKSDDDILKAVRFAKENNLKFHILGGGSNTVFSDNGYDGIVIFINTKGIVNTSGNFYMAKAGVEWDSFVELVTDEGFSGVECLSGIPGKVGATPIQNVGAYGQDVSEVISSVKAIDVETLDFVNFNNNMCAFSYRNSRFKSNEKGRYVITEVTFRLDSYGATDIRYKELADYLGTYGGYNSFNNNRDKLVFVRNAVLDIRKKKSMVYDLNDKNSYSCGSFFTNPVLDKERFSKFIEMCDNLSLNPVSYKSGNDFKVSAAWLIENSGFHKGSNENGIGISSNHSLALVNRGGTTEGLIKFSEKIVNTVFDKFGIKLVREPELI